MTKTSEATLYMWKRVTFPLWHPRPALIEFDKVLDVLQQQTRSYIRTNIEEQKAKKKDDQGWLEWSFDIPITERERIAICGELLAHYGPDVHGSFRWEGSAAKTEIYEVIALGSNIQ